MSIYITSFFKTKELPEGIVVFDTAGRNYYKLNDAKQGAKHAV